MSDKKVRILINVLSSRMGGGQTYLRHLLTQPIPANIEVFICPGEWKSQFPSNQIKPISADWGNKNVFFRLAWEAFVLPRIIRRLKIDVLFCPGGLLPVISAGQAKQVTMFRNMLPFDSVQRSRYHIGWIWFRLMLLKRQMLRSFTRADLVIFISQFGQQAIQGHLGRGLKKSTVIPHGLGTQFKNSDQPTIPTLSWLPKTYFVYVSAIEYYKNQVEVVEAFSLLKNMGYSEKLLLVGPQEPVYAKILKARIAELNLKNDVVLAGNLPSEALPSIYRHSTAIIFASLCENCPNILIESLGSGRPIFCSKARPMPEFAEDGVIYFDATNPNDLAKIMSGALAAPENLGKTVSRALEISKKYDWKKTAEQTWQSIAEVMP